MMKPHDRRVLDFLAHCAANDLPCPTNQVLADRCGLTHGGIAKVLVRLEKQGHIIRDVIPPKLRRVTITETGHKTDWSRPDIVSLSGRHATYPCGVRPIDTDRERRLMKGVRFSNSARAATAHKVGKKPLPGASLNRQSTAADLVAIGE